MPAYALFVGAKRIDGRGIAAAVRKRAAERAAALRASGTIPGLAALLVGNDPASISYITSKSRACEEAGIYSETFQLPAKSPQSDVISLVERLNEDDRFHGVLPQLPLPPHIDRQAVIEAIEPCKDVDGIHPMNLGRLLRGDTFGPIPCTPNGVLELLRATGNDPAGRHVVIIGRSLLVGRPLAMLLANKVAGANATVTLCHTGTADLSFHTKAADIIVVAAGSPGLLTGDMIKPGAVVIDVGTNRIEDPSRKRGWRLVGDADFDSVSAVASWITPVPGGVGPMTIAMLLINTVEAAERAISP